MQNVTDGLKHWLDIIPKELKGLPELEVSRRPSPNKWSKKEILGHLCDSAINNMERFVKIQYEEQPYVIPSYNQEQWVGLQHYQDTPLDEILNLFCALNKQIINILSHIPADKLSSQCDIGNNHQKTLEWLIQDYLEHMEHHIKKQILV